MIFNELFEFIIFILPCYVANAAPVAFNKIIPMKTPIDMGRKFIDGRRILGDGKTIEGFTTGVCVGTFVGIILTLLGHHQILTSLILAFGAMLGDALGSFIKRRLGVPRGKPLPLIDQLTFVVVALILCNVITNVPLMYYIYSLVITPPLHLGSNYVAYLLRLKKVPW